MTEIREAVDSLRNAVIGKCQYDWHWSDGIMEVTDADVVAAEAAVVAMYERQKAKLLKQIGDQALMLAQLQNERDEARAIAEKLAEACEGAQDVIFGVFGTNHGLADATLRETGITAALLSIGRRGMSKRIQCQCRCGRTVEITSFMSMRSNYAGDDECEDGWRYYVACRCGMTTDEYPSPKSAWAEWRKLRENSRGQPPCE